MNKITLNKFTLLMHNNNTKNNNKIKNHFLKILYNRNFPAFNNLNPKFI